MTGAHLIAELELTRFTASFGSRQPRVSSHGINAGSHLVVDFPARPKFKSANAFRCFQTRPCGALGQRSFKRRWASQPAVPPAGARQPVKHCSIFFDKRGQVFACRSSTDQKITILPFRSTTALCPRSANSIEPRRKRSRILADRRSERRYRRIGSIGKPAILSRCAGPRQSGL
jgi:hypothetical protein